VHTHVPRGFASFWTIVLFATILLLLFRIHDTLPGGAQRAYDHASHLFQQGYLAKSQQEAEAGSKQFQRSSPFWAARFQLLLAESMLYRGMYDDVLRELLLYHDSAGDEGIAEKLAIEAVALTRQNQVPVARARLAQADVLCGRGDLNFCGNVLSAHAILAIKAGQLTQARQYFLNELSFARGHNDRWMQASAALNLGYMAMQVDHYDEAVDWFRSANQLSLADGYKNILQAAAGNLGWAYFQLGDKERALEQFRQAELSAEALGAIRFQLKWLSTAGYIYQDSGDAAHALDSYRKSLVLAKQIGSKEDIVNALKDLATVSAENGATDQAVDYIKQITQIEGDAGGQSAQLRRTKCVLAASLHKDTEAKSCFSALRNDQSVLMSDRLDAGYQLAKLLDSEGDSRGAAGTYRSALDLFESARATLRSEESELPFGANASRIYDSYVHLLMQEGKTEQALATADESRAGTLEKGLDAGLANRLKFAKLNPQQIAQRANATLLFYWLGEKQSYLWAITPRQIATFTLPPQLEIANRVKNYSKKIISLRDPQRTGDADGEFLYKTLIAPAAAAIETKKQVIILADAELSELNFETLLVPDREAAPGDISSKARMHYLIDDMTLVSAPSLAMLKAPQTVRDRGGKMLLLGDPVSASAEFPSLPLFSFEMKKIESHFDKARMAVISGQQATPMTYLESNPAQYSYIHFVSHAVANRIVPLDSAIVLSKSSTDENSFKLYARDIIQHPIDAKLVTISACYGNGTRFYAGEGLVGLSWAFMHAGAQRVIGALWEVSDESTPRLMDGLYRGIEQGDSPAVSLRKAKLELLHSQSRFSLPFYWATFQIYDRQ
jgi:CHAT domain-containing protein/tetratricopeptide (TPR) repeat protein